MIVGMSIDNRQTEKYSLLKNWRQNKKWNKKYSLLIKYSNQPYEGKIFYARTHLAQAWSPLFRRMILRLSGGKTSRPLVAG